MVQLRSLVFIIAIMIARSSGLVPPCFYPDGSVATGDYACNLTATNSFCCGIGYACLGNRICSGKAYANGTAFPYTRGSCTDQTWQSPDCPQFCRGANNKPGDGSYIFQCNATRDPNEVCCYDYSAVDPYGCCSSSDADVFTLSGNATAFNEIRSAASTLTRELPTSNTATNSALITNTPSTGTPATSMTLAVTTGTNPTVTSSSISQSSEALTAGAGAGIAIGVVAGIALITFVAFILVRRAGQRSSGAPAATPPLSQNDEPKRANTILPSDNVKGSPTERVELEGTNPAIELSSRVRASELE